MPSRLEAIATLTRLRSLYGVVTHMHGVALEQAAAAVRAADARIDTQREAARRSSAHSLQALAAGDKHDWMIFEAQRPFLERVEAQLRGLRAEREQEFEAAAETYRENRLQLEQVRSVLRDIHLRLERERARRTQRESDDRFLSRLRWLERTVNDRMNGR